MSLIDPFLRLEPTGIKRLQINQDVEALLAFWFSIPEGEVLGNAGWGHPFKSRLFGIGSDGEIVVSQMKAVRKLRRDIPKLKISGIRGAFSESDLLLLTIYYRSGQGIKAFTGEVRL